MLFEVLEESDVMRATDRLVDRIREYQQMKVFVFQLAFLVITVGVLLNIIASLALEFLLRGLTTLGLYVLAIASLLVVLLSISTYLFSKRYFRGGLRTFVRYAYRLQPMSGKTKAVDIAACMHACLGFHG